MGVVIDVAGLANPGELSTDDFEFRVGITDDVSVWSDAPSPINDLAGDIRLGGGINGSDRITLIWPDGSIKNTWLEITVKATLNTGLTTDDVSYFGSIVGDTGNSSINTFVDASDFSSVRDNPRHFLNRAQLGNPYDLNRDSFVDGTDLAIVRDNATDIGTAVPLITPQEIGADGEPAYVVIEPPNGTKHVHDELATF